MSNKHSRMKREGKTIEVMITLYCHSHHCRNELCSECSELLDYALELLNECPFQEGKTTCVKCPVHCYESTMREKIRKVMRYSGPRMIRRHPILTVFHLLDGRRKEQRHRF